MIKIHTDDLIYNSYDGILLLLQQLGPETELLLLGITLWTYDKYKWDVGAESTISLYNDLLLKGNEHGHF